MFSAASAFSVPPVDSSSTPRAERARANGIKSVLSETERMARPIIAPSYRGSRAAASPSRTRLLAGTLRRHRPRRLPRRLALAGHDLAVLVLDHALRRPEHRDRIRNHERFAKHVVDVIHEQEAQASKHAARHV